MKRSFANSQSAKLPAWLLETEHHVRLPRAMEVEFSQLVKEADSSGREMTADIIWSLYAAEYLNITAPYELVFENAQAHAVPKQSGKCKSTP